MTTLMQASREWFSRPDDERFLSLPDMKAHFDRIREASKEGTVSSRQIHAMPVAGDNKSLQIIGPGGAAVNPTNYAFGQLCTLVKAPPSYLSKLPSPLAADCLNNGIRERDTTDVGVLLQHETAKPTILRAATGAKYGRIWNSAVVDAIIAKYGDGVTGDFRVPGEFGKAVDVTKDNTTLYAGDRDMFVFLADEVRRIEVPNRRNGQTGSLARGFFIWNSEVGDKSLGLGTFLFDYVCMNRIVWGATEYKEVRIRHTASAPDKFMEQIMPAIQAYANAGTTNITDAIEAARKRRIEGSDLDEFLAKRYTKSMVLPLKAIHEAEEGRPIESFWDAATAVTAYARSIPHADKRVALERQAGELIKA